MQEFRCECCGRLLFKYDGPLKIVIRCQKCGAWNRFDNHAAAPTIAADTTADAARAERAAGAREDWRSTDIGTRRDRATRTKE